LVGEKRDFKAVVREYESKHPQLRSRAFLYKKDAFFWGKVAYAVFIENAFNFIEQIEAAQIPFIFTLYPGGGFQLNNKVSDEKLRRVFASPFFRKVIVTQNVTYNYLVENKLCIESAIEFIYGVVLPAEEYKGGGPEKQKYLVDKQTFDICFVANKNMPKGEDKGFDKFIDVALNLGTKYEDIYFHVVGPFDGTEIDTSPIADKIKFYGYIHTDQFKEFYSAKDIIISPNIHFMLFPGAFDGFPTGACTEAGLNGVALFVSDTLGQNIKFKDGQDIVIIPHNSEKITEVVEEYYLNPEKTYALAERGQRRMEEIYSIDAQMGPRKTLIANILKEFEK
jgi:glycosyltransferase involved in cell wall biosynthesis